MGNQISFILKVLIISAVISVLIKYTGPSLPIAATSVNTLIAVLTPTLLCAAALFWRAKNYQPPN